MNIRSLLLAGLLLISLAGCSADSAGSSQPSAGDTSSFAPESKPAESSGGEEPQGVVVNNDFLQFDVSIDEPVYTLEDVINVKVTITNTCDMTLVYVQGSGANIVPDALEIDLGGFAGLFYPEVVTMDYRTEQLEPGKSLSYDCGFVPYISKDGTKAFGTDKTIDFFQTDDFTPATPGRVEGKATFTYYVQPADADPNTILAVESLDPQTVEVPVVVTIS